MPHKGFNVPRPRAGVRALPMLAVLLLAALALARAEESEPAWPQRAPAGSIRLAFLADGQEEENRSGLREMVALAARHNASTLLYGGDTTYEYGEAPPDWVDALSPFQNRTLFVYGNHDGGESYRPFLPTMGNETWWRWEKDGVVVLGLNTNRDLANGSPQARWLDARLDEDEGRLVIVMMHIPWWVPPYEGSQLPFPGDADEMRARMNETPAALVLAGHQHHYSRHEVDGIPYLITSAADAQLRHPAGGKTAGALVEAHQRTLVLLDASPCGVVVRVLAPDGETLDRVQHAVAPAKEDAARLKTMGLQCAEGDARPSAIPPPPTPANVTPTDAPNVTPTTTPLEANAPTPGAGPVLATLGLAAGALAWRRGRT